jgi:formylglycine-generating enzyme required for sulfatase activity
VIRGGGFINHAADVRSSNRDGGIPWYVKGRLGFRCARGIER